MIVKVLPCHRDTNESALFDLLLPPERSIEALELARRTFEGRMALSDPSGHRTTQAKYNLAKAVFVNQLYSKAEPVLSALIDNKWGGGAPP